MMKAFTSVISFYRLQEQHELHLQHISNNSNYCIEYRLISNVLVLCVGCYSHFILNVQFPFVFFVL